MNNNNYNDNIDIIPVLSYINAEKYKSIIYKENNNKSGIYRWNNLVTGSSYIGSAVNLTKRLRNYFSIGFLKKETRRNNSIISNALLKHGYNNFSVDILEYCEPSVLIAREQYYFDRLKCDYNILKIAGSRFGCKHSPETLLKFKNRKLSPEALINLKLAKAGKTPVYTPLRRINLLKATAHITTVMNKNNNTIKVYESINSFSREIGINKVTILKYINTNKWLRNTYLITRKEKGRVKKQKPDIKDIV